MVGWGGEMAGREGISRESENSEGEIMDEEDNGLFRNL